MARINTIERLLKNGWSHRRIDRELGGHRDTAFRYAKLFVSAGDRNPAISTAGSADGSIPTPPSQPAIAIAGKSGRQSQCEIHRSTIEAKLALELSAQRIWQDLRSERSFEGGARATRSKQPVEQEGRHSRSCEASDASLDILQMSFH